MTTMVSATDLQRELEGGKALRLVDVRTPAEYEEMHVAGATLMPLDRLEPGVWRGQACVMVCRSGKRAAQAAEKLAAAGCEDLRVLEGGVLAWERAGLPLERGRAVLSLERQVRIAAGLIVLLGVILGATVHGGFYGLSGFVGAGLVFAGVTDWCGMAMLLAKAPWNQRGGTSAAGGSCTA